MRRGLMGGEMMMRRRKKRRRVWRRRRIRRRRRRRALFAEQEVKRKRIRDFERCSPLSFQLKTFDHWHPSVAVVAFCFRLARS